MNNRLDGGKIALVPIDDSHAELIVKWRNNKRVKNNFIVSENLTPETHEKWLKEKVEKGLVKQFIIIEKESKKPIGSVYFKDIDCDKGKAEYGIFVGEDDAVGKGYGNEAAELALEYAFKEMKLKRLFLRVFEDNIVAIKSYENAGFKRIDREEIINKDGVEKKLLFMETERKQ